jgi:hypothetical protein
MSNVPADFADDRRARDRKQKRRRKPYEPHVIILSEDGTQIIAAVLDRGLTSADLDTARALAYGGIVPEGAHRA